VFGIPPGPSGRPPSGETPPKPPRDRPTPTPRLTSTDLHDTIVAKVWQEQY